MFFVHMPVRIYFYKNYWKERNSSIFQIVLKSIPRVLTSTNYSYNSSLLFLAKNRTNKPTRCFAKQPKAGSVKFAGCDWKKKKKNELFGLRGHSAHEAVWVWNPLIHIALKLAREARVGRITSVRRCSFGLSRKAGCVKHRHDNRRRL